MYSQDVEKHTLQNTRNSAVIQCATVTVPLMKKTEGWEIKYVADILEKAKSGNYDFDL